LGFTGERSDGQREENRGGGLRGALQPPRSREIVRTRRAGVGGSFWMQKDARKDALRTYPSTCNQFSVLSFPFSLRWLKSKLKKSDKGIHVN
jgi:hypothetical protein